MKTYILTSVLVLMLSVFVSSHAVRAQSACQVDLSLGRYICQQDELRRINAETDAIIVEKTRHVTADQIPELFSGVDAWYDSTTDDCSAGRSFVYNCVREMLISRRDAMRAVDGRSLFTAVDGTVYINLASRISRRAAIDLAYEYFQRTGQRYEYKVFLSRNGWYGVAYGPVWYRDFDRHLSGLRRLYSGIDPASFPTQGDAYVVFVTTARAPRPTRPAPQTSSRCHGERVRERQALCFVYMVGERACSEGLETLAADRDEEDGDAGDSSVSFSASLVCSSVAQALQNGDIDLGVLAMSSVLAGADMVGERLMEEDDSFSTFLGVVVRLTVATAQFTQALECARAEEERCGY